MHKPSLEKTSECPKCGNTKHHEVLRMEIDSKEVTKFKCKACGHTEYLMQLEDKEDDQAKIEHMGDAFREYLKKEGK